MAEIKLFSLSGAVSELPSTSVTLERELQNIIEQNMEKFFGVRFLKSEFLITNGRIDSLGLDENYSPVIFEYKRSTNENVINQGLFYLDWLLDHKADFKLLVMDVLGAEEADKIDWSFPCVICVAGDFTRYDEHAVNQMQRNIKLVRYKKFTDNLLLFEHLNAPKVQPVSDISLSSQETKNESSRRTFLQRYNEANEQSQKLYLSIRDYISSLGEDVIENQLVLYVAFKRVRNFACVVFNKQRLFIFLAIDPKSVDIQKDFTRDMTDIGHYGTGDLQVIIKSMDDFERAKPLIERAYNEG